jgi:two-component system response regulator DesR
MTVTRTELTDQDSEKKSEQANLTALIIDDEPANRDFLLRLIEQANYTTVGAGSGKEATNTLKRMEHPPRVIVIDRELPDVEGIELLQQLRKDYPECLIIMATMHDDMPLIRQAFECGCNVFLVKPHGFMELYKRLSGLDEDPSTLDNLIIDRMGVRPFRR